MVGERGRSKDLDLEIDQREESRWGVGRGAQKEERAPKVSSALIPLAWPRRAPVLM